MTPPREPTTDDLKVNLELCQHEVNRLRAKIQSKQALVKKLRARVAELEAEKLQTGRK